MICCLLRHNPYGFNTGSSLVLAGGCAPVTGDSNDESEGFIESNARRGVGWDDTCGLKVLAGPEISRIPNNSRSVGCRIGILSMQRHVRLAQKNINQAVRSGQILFSTLH
jgi:hypothetical protein